jgi:phage tail P2-like protein
MIDLRDAKLTDALPRAVAEQPWVEALAATWLSVANEILDCADKARVYTDIDNAPEELLDVLAIELRAPRYREDYDIGTKRRVVKTSLPYYTTVGTKAAVVKVMREMYGDAQVLEWFEYGGTPGTFRVNIHPEKAIDVSELLDILEQIKRASAKLEGLYLSTEEKQGIFIGFGMVEVGAFSTSMKANETVFDWLVDENENTLVDEDVNVLADAD